MEKRHYNNTIIFDFDGTLVDTKALYLEAKTGVAKLIQSHNHEMSLERIIEEFDKIDVEAAKVRGFYKERFHNSAITIYRQMVKDINEIEEKTVREIADEVLNNAPKTYKYVDSVLSWLKRNGCTLILYTEGDSDIQQSKLDKTGLGIYFSAVRIVPKKTEYALKEFLHELNKYDESTKIYYVGDSLLKDIAPAKACGLSAILINNDVDWWVSELDKETDQKPDYTVNNLESIIPIIKKGNRQKE